MNKKWRRVVAIVACAIMCLAIVAGSIVQAFAESTVRTDEIAGVGNMNSYDSGSSSSGGSYSSSSSSHSSSGSSGSFGFIDIVVFFIVVAIVIAERKRNHGDSDTVYTSKTNKPDYEKIIKEHDENFSEEKFLAWSKQVFMKLNEAWSTKDWKVIRPFESQELFEEHNTQLNEYIRNKTTNHIERVAIRQTMIDEYSKDDKYEYITVLMFTQMIDYVQEDETGKVIAGDKTTLWHMAHTLKFMRTLGTKTEVTEDGSIETTSCPNCGAPTTVTSAGECEYCHTVITKGNYGWVLVEFVGENI